MGPHGRHGRHSWGGGRGVQRGQISRLVEPCILQLLAEGPKHGYELMNSLVKFGFSPDIVESGMVYRSLRDMEMAGWSDRPAKAGLYPDAGWENSHRYVAGRIEQNS